MKKKQIFLYLILLLLVVGIIAGIILIQREKNRQLTGEELENSKNDIKVFETEPEDKVKETEQPVETDEPEVLTEPVETSPLETEVANETEQPATETAENSGNTLDFDSLWNTNSEIIAWIEIEGTLVDYPVLQCPTDDNKYLTTAFNGQYYIGGSLFTQATYNSKDFNDPVTVIYGHTMSSGTLFGQLQPIYTTSWGFKEYDEIKLYLPDEVRTYTVFAAVPFDPIHILHTYDFTNNYWYQSFFKRVFNVRAFGANFNTEITPKPGDRVLILSTCLNEDSTKRFLVMAIHQDDLSN